MRFRPVVLQWSPVYNKADAWSYLTYRSMFRSVVITHKIIIGIILSVFMFSYPVNLKLTVQCIRFAIFHFVYNMMDNTQMAIDCSLLIFC